MNALCLSLKPIQSLVIRARCSSTGENLNVSSIIIVIVSYTRIFIERMSWPGPRWDWSQACHDTRGWEGGHLSSQLCGSPPFEAGLGTERKQLRILFQNSSMFTFCPSVRCPLSQLWHEHLCSRPDQTRLSHRFSTFLTVSHRFSPFLTVSPRSSLFLTVSHRFSLFLPASPRFSPFFTVSHRFS